jgi:hypothetical protein
MIEDRQGQAGKSVQPSPTGADPVATTPNNIPPLTVSGFVVTKQDMLTVMRHYHGQVWDIEQLPDGDFYLKFGQVRPGGK